MRPGTVKSRLSRALRRLRDELGDGARTEPEARSMSADRLRRLDDEALAGAIRAAGGDLALARDPRPRAGGPSVGRRIEAAPGVGPVWPALPRRRRLVVLLAAALVLAGAARARRQARDRPRRRHGRPRSRGGPRPCPRTSITGDDLGRAGLARGGRATRRVPAALPRGPRPARPTSGSEQGPVGFDPRTRRRGSRWRGRRAPTSRRSPGTEPGRRADRSSRARPRSRRRCSTRTTDRSGEARRRRRAARSGSRARTSSRCPTDDGTLRAFRVDAATC